MTKLPHFVLFSRSEGLAIEGETAQDGEHEKKQGGSWYFRIAEDNNRVVLEASDFEPSIARDRLELLAVVRGLEAFDQPSRVTLRSPNPQISRAVRQGLDYWRDRNWMWERFGEKVPMRNCDLWSRIDRAIQIHDIRCRTLRFDPPQGVVSAPRIPLVGKENSIVRPSPGSAVVASANRVPSEQPELLGPRELLNSRDKQSKRSTWMGRKVSGLSRYTANRLRDFAESLSPFEDAGPHLTGNYGTEPTV